jgi:site-specific recombinase XerC
MLAPLPELAGLTCADVTLSTRATVHCVGKGRNERRTPLVALTRTVLQAWLDERQGAPTDPPFPTTTGKLLSRDAIERRLARHVATATASCQSITSKHITAHTLRHSRDATPALRRRRHRHRAVTRARADLDNQRLPPRRHGSEGASDRPDQPTRHQTRALPSTDTLLALLDGL